MLKTRSDNGRFQSLLRTTVLVPIALIVALCALFAWQLGQVLSMNHWIDHTDQVIAQMQVVKGHVVDAETGMRGFLNNGVPEFLEPFHASEQSIAKDIEDLRALVSDNPKQVARVETISAAFEAWHQLAKKRINDRRSGKAIDIQESIEGKHRLDGIRRTIADFLGMEDSLRLSRVQQAEQSLRFALLVTFLLGAVIAVFLAWYGRRRLLGLSDTYETLLAQQSTQAREMERQAWLRNGQSTLAESTHGELTPEEISRRTLQFIAEYVGARVGAIYAGDPGGGLKCLAGYGLSESERTQRQSLAPGAGLVGQVASEGRALVLRDAPEDYLRVSSALGYARPQAIMIHPLRAAGQVVGVIELGFFDENANAFEFLGLVSESAGTLLRSAELRARQAELLRQSQELNEKLQVQQEELRVNNEELEERSRALQQAQARLQNQQAELEQTNAQLEEQAQILESQKDALDEKNIDLERKSRSLELASRYKSEFLANMSHELRTPLNSALILARLLATNKEKNLTAQQVEYAETIYSSGSDLLNLINDVLDLSKVEAGRIELRPEPFRLETLVESLRKVFEPLARERKLRFAVEIAPDAPLELVTDRQRLEQVVKNFLSNAFKFTHEGGVTLSVRSVPYRRIAISVRDTGIGIPKEQHHMVFEAFKQADGTTSRKYGGTGLGLSISKELARLLGGEIQIESEPGKGSEFTLLMPTFHQPTAAAAPLPVAPTATVAAPPAPAPARAASPPTEPAPVLEDDRQGLQGSEKRVLIIEDDPTFRRILCDLAHERGYRCIITESAVEGIRLAREYRPHAVILDVKLPDQSGLSVLDQLKRDLHTRHIPVHVISGADYTRPALEMGAAGFLQKPVQAEELARTFSDIEGRINQKLQRVLIIEDDVAQQKSMRALIEAEGVEIVAVGTATEAQRKMKEGGWDCIILDLGLPDHSGYDLLEENSRAEGGPQPPVIVYTGRDLSRDEEDRLRRVSSSIIVKGASSPERLLDEVTLFLHQVESELPPERRQMLHRLTHRDQALQDKTILVVDDDVRNVFALTAALEDAGARVEIARNGRESLEKLKANSTIDLVLMDIMMPEMDGFEATRRIRKMPGREDLPIIAITAKAMRDDQDRCIEAGANDYLAKPIDLGKLMNLIRIWLPRSRRNWS